MGACSCICKKTDHSAEILSELKDSANYADAPQDSLTLFTNVPIPEAAEVIDESKSNSNENSKPLIMTQSIFRRYYCRKLYFDYLSMPEPEPIPIRNIPIFNDFNVDLSELPAGIPSTEAKVRHALCGKFDFGGPSDKKFFTLQVISEGNYYHGEIDEDGNPDGKGSMFFSDGTLYEGGWKSGKMHGKGRIISLLGDLCTGEFVNGRMTGKGVMEYINGNTFEGELLNDKPHGYGKEITSDGTIYEGEYRDGLKNGKGKSTWADGSNYEGYFLNDLYEGFGKYCWPDKVYEGEWKESKMHGKGTFKWNDGKMYSGNYVMGIKHGYGVFEWPDGKRYEGGWIDGKQEGEGVLLNKGKKRRGTWKEGKFAEKISTEVNDSKLSDNN